MVFFCECHNISSQINTYICCVKQLKNSFLLASLALLFFLGNQPKAEAIVSLKENTTKQFQSTEIIQSVGTIQLIAEPFSYSFVKDNTLKIGSFVQFLPLKDFTFFVGKFPNFLSRQDHNRCEKVSKLIFPFHFFW